GGKGVGAVRRATRKPLIVKVSRDSRQPNKEPLIPAALDAGITIVNCGNTRRVEDPRLSQGSGGLSGPALFATTLENVRRLRDRFGSNLEIIACGGVDDPAKACAVLEAGGHHRAVLSRVFTPGPPPARVH